MGITRDMRLADLDQILLMEEQHQIHPWSKASFEQALRLGQYCLVYENAGAIEAYGVANKGHGRTICAINIEGADAIYKGWFDHAKAVNAPTLYAEIEVGNRAARIRLRRFGFKQTGTIPAFYGPGHSAQFWSRSTEEITEPDSTGQNKTGQGFSGIAESA